MNKEDLKENLEPHSVLNFIFHPSNGDLEMLADEELSYDDLILAADMLTSKIAEIDRQKSLSVYEIVKETQLRQQATLTVLQEMLKVMSEMGATLKDISTPKTSLEERRRIDEALGSGQGFRS